MPGHTDADLRARSGASVAAAATIVALGVCFDLALNGQRPGLSVPLLTFALAAGVRGVAPRRLENDLLLGSAVVVSVFVTLRASAPLLALDVLAVLALLGVVATSGTGAFIGASVLGLLGRGFELAVSALGAPPFLLASASRAFAGFGRRRVVRALRAAAIVVTVVAAFAALLASGDRVFGSALSRVLPSWDLSGVAGHVALAVTGMLLAATLVRASFSAPHDALLEMPERARPLRFVEWAGALAALDLLFAAFVAVQFAFLFGGGHRVAVTSGLTYAEYARSGFLQLIVAAGLTVVVILGAWDLGERTSAEDRWFRRLAAAMVALASVVLASALMRLALYEQRFGFTMNRLGGYLAIVWIALVLGVLLAAIWTGRRDRFVSLALVAGLAVLMGANVMNPERFVADRNAARYASTGRLDVAYLGGLGADAVPVMAGLLPALAEDDARQMRSILCGYDLRGTGWRSWNLGRAQARDALARGGIRPCAAKTIVPSE